MALAGSLLSPTAGEAVAAAEEQENYDDDDYQCSGAHGGGQPITAPHRRLSKPRPPISVASQFAPVVECYKHLPQHQQLPETLVLLKLPESALEQRTSLEDIFKSLASRGTLIHRIVLFQSDPQILMQLRLKASAGETFRPEQVQPTCYASVYYSLGTHIFNITSLSRVIVRLPALSPAGEQIARSEADRANIASAGS